MLKPLHQEDTRITPFCIVSTTLDPVKGTASIFGTICMGHILVL